MKCKQKCEQFFLWKYENVYTKGIEQCYRSQSYFKLMLNKLNIMGTCTFIYTHFKT
jgi:hypothetical protein